MDLKRSAVNFLLYEKQCDIVSFERGINDYWGRPDILGVTRDRKLIEIEIKESFSDFKANFDKLIIKKYQENPEHAPHYFYFLVNPDILQKVLEYTNDKHTGYGILSIHRSKNYEELRSYKKSSLNKNAKKVSIPCMVQMVKNQSRSFMDLWQSIEQKIESKVNDRIYNLNKEKIPA